MTCVVALTGARRLDLAQIAGYPGGMIRAFLALPVPESVARALSLAQARLPLPRPVPPENFHITLAFLDAQPEPVLEDLHLTLEGLRLPAPRLALAGFGSFGGAVPDNVHALIAPDPALAALQAKVSRAARQAGIALPARRFVPHITLGRGPHDAAALARALAGLTPLRADPWTAPEMILYRSTLLKSGSAYDPMAAYPLNPGALPA